MAYRDGDEVVLYKYITDIDYKRRGYLIYEKFDKKIAHFGAMSKHFIRLKKWYLKKRKDTPIGKPPGKWMLVLHYNYGGEVVQYIPDSAKFLSQMRAITHIIISNGYTPRDICMPNILINNDDYILVDYEMYGPIELEHLWKRVMTNYHWYEVLMTCSNLGAVFADGKLCVDIVQNSKDANSPVDPTKNQRVIDIAMRLYHMVSMTRHDRLNCVILLVATILYPVETYKYISYVCKKDYMYLVPNIPESELDFWSK